MKFIVSFLFFVVACSAVPHARQVRDVSHIVHEHEVIPIVKQFSDVRNDGFNWEFEAGNGIAAKEEGSLKNVGTDKEAAFVQGQASWTAPDGTPVFFTYVADENGYHPEGQHLPTPPPIPEAIVRALEWIKAHPEPEEKH